ncbi:hypothetical protein [Leeuwenhoekiella marinoflava]|uniref:hypothetical protein n=1 Tax=Leeuwenhoekiella marinoflava TaxID=988 RepID=UPI003000FDF7
MAAQTPNYHKCQFTEINPGKYRTVRHYEPQEGKMLKGIFSNLINISNNRAFAKSTPEYWVKCKEGKKWGYPVTGLFKTEVDNVFKGDLYHKTHLLIMHFSNDHSTVTAYLFPNYYTRDLAQLLSEIIQ